MLCTYAIVFCGPSPLQGCGVTKGQGGALLLYFSYPKRRSTPSRQRSVSLGLEAGKDARPDGGGRGSPGGLACPRGSTLAESQPASHQKRAPPTPLRPRRPPPTHDRLSAGSTCPATRVRAVLALPSPDVQMLRELHISPFCVSSLTTEKVGSLHGAAQKRSNL